MSIVKKSATGCGCFVVLFVVLTFVTLFAIGAVAGVKASGQHPNDPVAAQEAAGKAGEEVGRKYGLLVIGGCFLFSGIAAGVLSFGGVLPWCRD